MPDTVEHRVEMHQVAQERRKAGKPVWDRKIGLRGIVHNEDMTFEQKRDKIVRILRDSAWVKNAEEDDELHQVVEELGDADNVEWFGRLWDRVYDLADADRVWINTF